MRQIREHMVFTGRVQGVGFRYKICRLARHYGVTGWARNDYDGSVEAELQGTRENIDLVIRGLRDDAYIVIDWIARDPMELKQENGFQIRG